MTKHTTHHYNSRLDLKSYPQISRMKTFLLQGENLVFLEALPQAPRTAKKRNCRCCYFQTPSVVHCMNATASAQSPKFLRNFYPQTIFANFTRKRSCTSVGNVQAQLHFRDDQQRSFGISNISNYGNL